MQTNLMSIMARRKTSSKSTKMLVSSAVILIIVFDLLHIGHTDAALLPSDDIGYSPKYYENLSGGQDISETQQKGPQQQPVKGPQQQHLMKLLAMKDSLSDLLTPNQMETLTSHGTDDGDAQLNSHGGSNVNTGGYRDIQPPAHKRVFCNGFTGCGGRFRTQRRRQGQHGADKRVFCNSQGCRNGGRKRGGMAEPQDTRSKEEGFNLDLWRQALKRLEDLQLGKLHQISKKLFCNYGGCRNVGKRRGNGSGHHLSSLDTADAEGAPVAHELLPKLDFVSSRQGHSNGKRFFSSNVDGDLDALLAGLE